MELLTVGRVLLRRRTSLAVGLILAAGVGAVISGVLPLNHSASARRDWEGLAIVLVDTKAPLVATATPYGAATITQRSVLLAAQMGSRGATAMIARQARVPVGQLAVTTPTFAPVDVNGILPAGELPQQAALAAQAGALQPFIVNLVADYQNPVIAIGTAAPTAREARSLVEATIATLQSATAGSAREPVNVESQGSAIVARSPGSSRSHHLLGLLALIGVVCLWCTGIVVFSGLARAWKAAGLPAASTAG
ncbi:MAG: hypothetical protein M3076_04470 [Actinomycetota bacterium]|nr:hypothetical protein [Actinomycetota bacterium]